MFRSRVQEDLERVRELPFFPLVPLVPIALAVTNLVLVGLVFWKVSKLEERAV